jgi:hypothetical protein
MWNDFSWGYFWRACDLVSLFKLDEIDNSLKRLQSARAKRVAATTGSIKSPPEKPRPPCAVYK